MAKTYIAIVTKAAKWFDIEFPDLPGAHAQAQTLDEVNKEAQSAACEYLAALRQIGEPEPASSTAFAWPGNPDQFAILVFANVDEYLKLQDNRTIKKTVSLPAWMANSAEINGLSLSKVLQDALKTQLPQ